LDVVLAQIRQRMWENMKNAAFKQASMVFMLTIEDVEAALPVLREAHSLLVHCELAGMLTPEVGSDPFSWRTPQEYLSRKFPFLFRTLNMF
jgi:hypothetical protein